jgi:hypothetical protein
MRVPIRHVNCGGLIAHYITEICKIMSVLESKTFELLDGSNPAPCSEIFIKCPKCNQFIFRPSHMERCFEEVVL